MNRIALFVLYMCYARPLYRVRLLILVLRVSSLSYACASYACVMGILSTVAFMLELVLIPKTRLKAGVHVKAVLTSLNTAFLPTSRSFQATLNLSAYFINHCLAVLCKFYGDFWAFLERDIFKLRERLG